MSANRRPVIGVSSRKIYFTHDERPYPRFGVAINYVEAVEAAGGAPLMLPLTQSRDVLERLLDICDGLVLTGGFDVDPSWYDEEPHQKLGQVNPLRDLTEIVLSRAALERDMPIFGICRGMQVLNVAAGGSLWQDIPAQLGDDTLLHFQQLTEEFPSHSIDVADESWLQAMTGQSKVRINSYHHQSVKKMADGFVATGIASDGVIEAMESRRHRFCNAVQWHPELLYHNLDFNLAMFRSHVEAAGRYALEKAGSTVG